MTASDHLKHRTGSLGGEQIPDRGKILDELAQAEMADGLYHMGCGDDCRNLQHDHVKVYHIEGSWVDGPFITPTGADMVMLSEYQALQSQLAKAEAALAQKTRECEEAKAANELDRRSLWAVVRAIDEEITGRMWLIEGRGNYEWDDDKYRQEFGWAVHALQEKLEPLRKIAHDLKNCPETEQGVNSVRKLEAQVEQLGRQVAEMEARIETLIGTTCKRCERGDSLFVEPDTGFYTHTLGGNYCDAHRLHSVLNTKVGVEARARTK